MCAAQPAHSSRASPSGCDMMYAWKWSCTPTSVALLSTNGLRKFTTRLQSSQRSAWGDYIGQSKRPTMSWQHTQPLLPHPSLQTSNFHSTKHCWGHAVYSNYLLGLRSWARTEPYQFAQLIRILQRRETGHELGEDRQRWRVQWVILVLTLHVCAQERKSRCSPLYVSMTLAPRTLLGVSTLIHTNSYNGVRLTISCWRNFQISGKYSLTNVSHCGEFKKWMRDEEKGVARETNQLTWKAAEQQVPLIHACSLWQLIGHRRTSEETNSVHCRVVQQVQRKVATSI